MNFLKENEEDYPLPDGTYPVKLSLQTQEELECVAGQDMHALEPHRLIDIEVIRADIAKRGNHSDFSPLRDQIMKSRVQETLLVYNTSRATQGGSEFLLCLQEDSKFGYQQAEEDAALRLIDKSPGYTYRPPTPKGEWESIGSDAEVQGARVKNSRSKISLQVRRSVSRRQPAGNFSDRDVSGAKDGYVACESSKEGDRIHATAMERAVQAVPTVAESGSQTVLRHPKNVAMQYEARVFSQEEVAELWKSEEMKKFLGKAERIMTEVSMMPDIMGSIREEVEAFYRRDEVIIIEETKLVHRLFFSDLVFTRDMRVTHVRWHPDIPGIVAMSVIENVSHEEYLDNLSKRLSMPNVLTVWSIKYPFFPQLILRICDDVTTFEWHPLEEGTLVGGCMNGQLVIWDISEYIPKLKEGVSTWNHKVFLSSQKNKLHIEEGYIPLLHWSAESDKERSHLGAVESVQWLPKTVWFSYDSAFPKSNQNDDELQLISCDGDRYVLIWALRKAPTDDGVDSDLEEELLQPRLPKSSGAGWEKLKLQSPLPASLTSAGSKYSPAVGKYESLNKVWRPVHKICFCFANPYTRLTATEDDLFQVLITSMCVVDRPDLMMARKDSMPAIAKEYKEPLKRGMMDRSWRGKQKPQVAAAAVDDDDDDDDDDEDKEREAEDPAQMALPTFLLAGTIFGSVFRVDLAKVRVDVETNDLIAKVEWDTPLHDGPVKVMSRSPHTPHLILTVGGYSWAIWSEGVLSSPVIFHYVEDDLFTDAAWSLAQPDVIFFAEEGGKLQVWNVRERKSEPSQSQNISGRTINVICPYAHETEDGETVHYVSAADETGTLHLLELPKHLRESSVDRLDSLLQFVEDQISKQVERKALREQTADAAAQRTAATNSKKNDEEEFEKERHVTWDEGEYLKAYFQRERRILENIYGEDWKKHVKYPELPRKKYYVEVRRRDSSEERRRQKELLKAKKKKGGSIFRKY